MPKPLQIRLEDLTLTRDERPVLRNINWEIRGAQRWWIMGPNGAGKTQLLKLLAGDVWPDPTDHPVRRYRYRGEDYAQPGEVKEEIAYLGPERQDRYERHGWDFPAWQVVATGIHRSDIPLEPFTPAQRRRSLELLRAAGALRLAGRNFLSLSYGERRLVLVARALAWRPALLLLDEVATGLDGVNRKRLMRLLRSHAQGRVGWVASAHRPEDLPPGATHLLRLEAGEVVQAGPLDAKTRRLLLTPPAATRPVAARRAAAAPVHVQFRSADVYLDAHHVLHKLDLTVRRGECWVIHGANGSGKSTLLRTVYGDHGVAYGGVLKRAGIAPGVPLEQFRARTGLVAPQLQTDYPRDEPVIDVVVSGLHSSIGLNEPSTPAEQRRARATLARHGWSALADRQLGELSYGQVRRVLFARALIRRPRLLLLDEPYAGVDAATRAGLQQLLGELLDSGLTVMIATHYRSEWPAQATHELQLQRGRIVYQGSVRR